MIGDGRADLEPYRRAEPAPGQLALKRLQQVLVPVVVDLEFGVAGDPEQMVLDDLHAREELSEVGRDQLLDRHEPGPPRRPSAAAVVDAPAPARVVHRDEPGHVVGHLDAGEQFRSAVRVADEDGEVERESGDVREGVRRVDREGSQHREDLLAEVRPQAIPVVLVQVDPAQDLNVLRGQRRLHVGGETFRVAGHQFGRAIRDAANCSRGVSPSGPSTGRPVCSRRCRPATRTM